MKTDRTMAILKETIRDDFQTLRRFEREGNDRMIQFMVYENLTPLVEFFGKCIGRYLILDYQNGHFKLMTSDQFLANKNTLTSR